MIKGYTVYMHTTPSNKRYIGITGQQPYNRWLRGKGYAKNDYFTKAINKYGWDNIKSETLYKHLTKEKALEKEIKLIREYNTTNRKYGYNISKGGDKINAKKVICITTGDIFNSMAEAANKFKLSTQSISKNCTGERKSVGFYTHGQALQFAYYKEGKKYRERDIGNLQQTRRVVCTNTKEIFDTVNEAARKYELSQGSISKCCMGQIRSAGKLPSGEYSVWVYEEDYDESKDYSFHRHKGKHNPKARSVICLNTLEVFDTITDAAQRINIISSSKISMVCRGERKSCGKLPNGEKLKWMYYDEFKAL